MLNDNTQKMNAVTEESFLKMSLLFKNEIKTWHSKIHMKSPTCKGIQNASWHNECKDASHMQ